MMQTVDQAFSLVEQQVQTTRFIRVPVQAAHGHWLAEAVLMESDSPPFDRALLDGYAVRSADAQEGAQLIILGRQDAGAEPWKGKLQGGECLAINTGAILPAGADAVLMVEHSRRLDESGKARVRVMKAVAPGLGIQRRGAQAKAGCIALPAGIPIRAATIAALIAAGAKEVAVWRKPRVAVLATGDELVAAGTNEAASALGDGQIRNSNSPMLISLVKEAGFEAIDLGACGDERELLRGRLEEGLREADVFVVTGGMSMGTRDLVPPLLKELGIAFHIEKVCMKPGKPFVFGTCGEGDERKYVAGLPGNPVSAFVTFHLFVRRLLDKLARGAMHDRFVAAEVGGAFSPNGDREFFEPCVLSRRGATLIAEPAGWSGSGDILAISRLGDRGAFARRPANAPGAQPGETIQVLPLA